MGPHLGRIAFNIAVLLVVLALVPLPFLNTESAEFIVDVTALIFGLSFLFFVSWDVRRQAKKESGRPEKR